MAAAQPRGTVTLFFSDIEGSTRLLHELGPEAYREALAEHRRVMREAFERHGGYEVDYEGDAFFVAFVSAGEAVAAASEAQAALADGPIRVRMGLHTGEPILDPPKYVGMDVHLAARVMSAGHGGQVVLTGATSCIVDVDLTDLGEHRLKDFDAPVPLFQLGSERFPPLKTIANTNLPRPASSFVGRERETEEVLALVRESRLVTLTGPGGTGKTRLAIEAATELVPEFKAGVFWVGLATVHDPALVVETVAQAIGAKGDLPAHIADREMLLLLDNFEQVVEAAAELSALLGACPDLHLLVTSRERLRLDGETECAVPPLTPGAAVELFCRRSGLAPSDQIEELCHRLDDIPLALELAAARASVLTPAQILDRLGQRLDLLKGRRDADPRQQTLRATIEWSYELLTPDEQALFAWLAVFPGGCTLDAAEAVAHAELDTLQSLVDKSLVRHTNGRFWMLETIREYAGEKLRGDERSVLEEQLVRWVVDVLPPQPPRRERASWRAWIRTEYPNLRLALESLLERGDADPLARVVSVLAGYWDAEGELREGRRWIEQMLAMSDEITPDRAAARNTFVQTLRIQGEFDEARVQNERVQAEAAALGDRKLLADAKAQRGGVEYMAGDLQAAAAAYEASIALYEELGNDVEVVVLRHDLGLIALTGGDFSRARVLLEEAYRGAAANDLAGFGAGTLGSLGFLALAEGNAEEALTRFSDSMAAYVDADDIGISTAVDAYGLAAAIARRGDPARARALVAALDSYFEATAGGEPEPAPASARSEVVAAAENELSPDEIREACRQGGKLALADAIAVALARTAASLD